MKILILSAKNRSYATLSLKKAAQAKGHDVTILDPSKLSPFISSKTTGYDRLYDNFYHNYNRVYLGEFDIVIPRMTNINYTTSVLDVINNNIGVYSTQSASAIQIASNKLSTTLILSAAGIPVPITTLVNDASAITKIIKQLGGLPIVCKTSYGSQGKGVSILESMITAKSIIQTLISQKTDFILQEYIAYKSDVRAVVIGDRVIAMQRKRIKGDFRSNISMGAEGIPIELNEDDKQICRRAAKIVGLDVCGVDLLITKNKTYVIEVNSNFGFKIQKITKAPIAEYIIDYAINMSLLHNKKREDINSQQRTINSMQKTISDLEKNLSIYEGGEFEKLTDTYRGKKINYIDKNGNKRHRVVSTIKDVFMIAQEVLIFKD